MRFELTHIAASAPSKGWCAYSLPAAIETMSIRLHSEGGIATHVVGTKALFAKAAGLGRLGTIRISNDQPPGAPA